MKAFTTASKYWVYKHEDQWVVILPVEIRDPLHCGIRWFESFQGACDWVSLDIWLRNVPPWTRGLSYR